MKSGSALAPAALLLAALLLTNLAGCSAGSGGFAGGTGSGGSGQFAGADGQADIPYQPRSDEASAAGDYLIARQAWLAEDLAAASLYFQAVLEGDPGNPTMLRHAFLVEMKLGRIAAAIALAGRAEEIGRAAPFMQLTLGVDEVARGEWDRARERFHRLPDSHLNRILAPLLVGWTASAAGDQDQAQDHFASLYPVAGFEILALLHAGQAFRLSGAPENGTALLSLAFEKSAEKPLRLILAVAGHYAASGRLEEAVALVERAAAYDANLDPPAIEAVLTRIAGGAESVDLISGPEDGLAEALFDLAGAMHKEGAQHGAIILGRLALHLRPDFPPAQLLVGEILEDSGHWEEAIALYRAIDRETAYYRVTQFRLAASLHQRDETAAAIAILTRLTKERPADPVAWIRIGDMRRSEERWPQAIIAYDRAIALIASPEAGDWGLFYARGVAAERVGDWAAAERDFLYALDLSPEQPYVMNYLGYSWAEKGVHLERARTLLQRAAALRPNDGYIIDSLGWILFRFGQFEDAASKLEYAVRLRPDDPTINDHLGDAYWRLGRRLEARLQWQRALKMEPEAELEAAIMGKLRNGLPASDTGKTGRDASGA